MRNALCVLSSTSRSLCQHRFAAASSILSTAHGRARLQDRRPRTNQFSGRATAASSSGRSIPSKTPGQCRWYSTQRQPSRNVFVALGSNVGDSVNNIEQACRMIDESGSMRIVDTSCLYRTTPMYVEDQADFVNGACELETSLSPMDLLDSLQGIENALGRVKIIEKGPRNIDLDIIGFRDETVSTDRLTVPHALLHERPFVLRPLCNLKHGRSWMIPGLNRRAHEQLASLKDDLQPFTTLGKGASYIKPLDPGRKTMIMSILNVTPDSFSDGGKNFKNSADALRKTIRRHIAEGAMMIDIGGQSSRPEAADITAQEELDRIMPAIEVIKSLPEACDVIISIDTYRAAVARASVEAGAHIVNDISAGLLDPEMLPTVARLGCTYVMMHMRGTPATMSSKQHCSYAHGVIDGAGQELEQRLEAALEAGIRRWRIILDPGIGFAKDVKGNLALLRDLRDLRARRQLKGLPWLVGTSKKRFIGTVTGVEDAAQRNWGTAATMTAAVAGGADIVRVHDIDPMRQVVSMADAIYR